ncbi:MAG TPA: ISL3 family transposase [Candidatus Udaeobacter sp.]|nr:ISL3 family transposase [Candidatus Udaeobacter sp.]
MRIEHLAIVPQGIFILLACAEADAVCPACQHQSSRVASRYVRNVADLPWRQMPVVLRLEVRRFFCDQADCPRKVFAEQFPQIARRHGRRTVDQEKQLAQIGMTCGGQAGARLAQDQFIHASGDTVLRCLRRHGATPTTTAARIVGIDDFAFRKGCRYGTLLVDHESGKLLDLLDERSSESTAAMLACYPNVQTVTRDRYDLFANGIKAAHPHATQIADRFHLHMNLNAAVERLLERHRGEIARATEAATTEAAATEAATTEAAATEAPAPTNDVPATTQAITPTTAPKPTVAAAMRARYEQAIELRRQGQSIHTIRKQTKLNLRTIMKYLRVEGLPPRIKKKSRRKRTARISPRRLSVLLLHQKAQRKPREKKIVEHLLQQSPSLSQSIDLARQCSTILRERDSGKLLEWIGLARQAAVPRELQNFAKGLEQEWSSVKPAMDLPWSNARAEGHVNRLKLIKRSMYGRGNIDLLRLRANARAP